MSTAAFTEVHGATAVRHACAAFFTRSVAQSAQPELLVSLGDELRVYTPTPSGLRCEASFTLHGGVESMAVLRRRSGAPRSQRDALLLTSREAKLSVVEWEPASRGLRTSSLHRWEGRPDSDGGAAAKSPRVLADPEGRAAAVLLGGGGEVALLAAVRPQHSRLPPPSRLPARRERRTAPAAPAAPLPWPAASWWTCGRAACAACATPSSWLDTRSPCCCCCTRWRPPGRVA